MNIALLLEMAAAADVRTWVSSRLRSSRSPQDVHFVDELPYTGTGKLLRRALRRRIDGSTPQRSPIPQERT
jgi:acyl-coenzyme A synthetase/AMP-(fatty) acid ligase